VTELSEPAKALGPRYYGHGSAETLRQIVESGTWVSVDLGRTVRHYYSEGTRFIMRVGPRSPFAACATCGTFAKVSYSMDHIPFCSTGCLP